MCCPICGSKRFLIVNGNGQVKKCHVCKGIKISKEKYIKVRLKDLPYELNQPQVEASIKLMKSSSKFILIHAVCGAGKTEIVYKLMKESLVQGLRVAFVTPRKHVTKELHERFQGLTDDFVGCWYGGSDKEYTQLLFLTTHQLYAHRSQFDLVVFDEVDAFPFKENSLLKEQLFHALKEKGRVVYLSATPSKKLIKEVEEVIEVPCRYHGYPHPDIQIRKLSKQIMKNIIQDGKWLVYVPSIKVGEDIAKWLNTTFIHSRSVDIDNILNQYKEDSFSILISTIILERGITFKGVNVLVYMADHDSFQHEHLVQIAGRVGRKKDFPTGEIIFLYKERSRKLNKVVREIEYWNNESKKKGYLNGMLNVFKEDE